VNQTLSQPTVNMQFHKQWRRLLFKDLYEIPRQVISIIIIIIIIIITACKVSYNSVFRLQKAH